MVDIIIPFHGKYELVTKCLASVYACTKNIDYRVILVDDCSPNPHFMNSIIKSSKTSGIRLEKHSGFGAAFNAGLTAGSGKHVVLLHSDMVVTSIGWLSSLRKGLAKLKTLGVRMVFARTNSVGSASCGVTSQSEEEVNDFVGKSPLPLLCFYCHRELFSRIGGGLKEYPYGWYEDEELYWRMKYYGYSQAIVGNSWVEHLGGATVNSLPENVKKLMENNRQTCLTDVRHFLQKSPPK